MGLFGGFKAKLKGKEKKAKKKRDKEEVVCVNFKFFGEFDDAIPSCSKTEPEVVRERRTKPQSQGVFTFNTEVEKATPNTLINGDVNKETQFEKTQFGKTQFEKINKIKLEDDTKKESAAIKSPNTQSSLLPTSSVQEEPPRKIDIAAHSSSEPVKTLNSPSSSTISARNNFQEEFSDIAAHSSPEAIKPSHSASSTLSTISVKEQPSNPEEHDGGDDDGNFTIHITNHNGDLSVDEESSDDEDYSDLSPMNYSSQATSIFFGGEEEPVIMRPRNVMINQNDNDLSDGSSASA